MIVAATASFRRRELIFLAIYTWSYLVGERAAALRVIETWLLRIIAGYLGSANTAGYSLKIDD